MKNNAPDIEVLFGMVEDCGKTSLELFKLQAIEKYARIFSTLASRIVVLIFVALFTLCLNIGLALWIGEVLGKVYYGFFIIAGFYSLVATLVFLYRKLLIEEPVRDTIIDKMMEN